MPVFEKFPASEKHVLEAENYIESYETETAVATTDIVIGNNIIEQNITHIDFCDNIDSYDWYLIDVRHTKPCVYDRKNDKVYIATYDKIAKHWELEPISETAISTKIQETIEVLRNNEFSDYVYFIWDGIEARNNIVYKSVALEETETDIKHNIYVDVGSYQENPNTHIHIEALWNDTQGILESVNIKMGKETKELLEKFGITKDMLATRLKEKLEHYITKEFGNYPINAKIENYLSGYGISEMMGIGKRMAANTNDLYYKEVIVGTTHVEIETDGNLADENESLETGWFDMLMAREQVIRVWDEGTDFSFGLIMDVSGEITIDASKPYFAQTIENIFLTQLLDKYYNSLAPEQFAIVASKFMEAYKNGNIEYFDIKQVEELQNVTKKQGNKNKTQTRGHGLK